jgi:hypothetical protein
LTQTSYAAIRLHGLELDFFTTLEAGILGAKREIKTLLGRQSVTPDEVVKLEAL